MGDFLNALPVVATSPLALIGYALAVTAWLVAIVSARRTKVTFAALASLPEADRIKALAMEYRTVPKSGLSAEQWLRSRRMLFLLIAFGATLLAVLLLAALTYSLAMQSAARRLAFDQEMARIATESEKGKTERIRLSAEELCAVLDNHADAIARELNGHTADKAEFLRLHHQVTRAIKSGDLVLAHDVQSRITAFLFRLRKLYDFIDVGYTSTIISGPGRPTPPVRPRILSEAELAAYESSIRSWLDE